MNFAPPLSAKANSASGALTPDRVLVPDKELRRLRCYAVLGASDILALAIAYLSANSLYLGDIRSTHGVTLLIVLAPIYLGIATLNNAYSGEVLEHLRFGITRSIQAFAFACASVLLIVYLLKAGNEFSRAIFLGGSTVSPVLIALFRVMLRKRFVQTLGGTPYTTVVVRDETPYQAQPSEIVVTVEQLGFDPLTKDPISYHALAEFLANADRVIIACPQERYVAWASVLKGMALAGEILADDHDRMGLIGVGRHHGRQTMIVAAGPLYFHDRLLKRAFDIFFSALSILTLAPVLIAIAIAIKLESKGPILFVQSRIGRDNRLFKMFKFRSMYTDMCDADAVRLTGRQDDRVTRVGNFIRRTSCDELPQLFNVLIGDMSIVGPRPHALSAKAADLLYWDVDPRYRHRHSMKPGLTGLAQVRGFRGNTERTEDLTNRLQADLEYTANWSIWFDLQIILRTVGVLTHSNAF